MSETWDEIKRQETAELRAEIERLRDALVKYDLRALTLEAELNEADNENAVLRARLKWFEDAGGVAVTTKVHQQHTEIELLRGLLEEWLNGGPGGANTFRQRVKEALGDE
jgi:hypothetical protein